MRRILLTTLLCAAAAYPSMAAAQQPATRSVDDYLCTFAGKCGGETDEEVTKEAPETKGFSLARPGSKVAPPTRGFSLARPKPAVANEPVTKALPVKEASATTRPIARTPAAKAPRKSYATATKAVGKPKKLWQADEQRRADLRLTFELGSATLTPQAMEEAKVFAESMKRPELAAMRFRIEGHTDSQGGRAYNMDLSQRRAEAVAEYLQTLGVSPDRLEVRGFGFDRPLDGRSAAAQENRRVEAVLTS